MFQRQQLFIGRHTSLPLRLAGFGRHVDPVQFMLQCTLTFAFRLLFNAQAFLLLLKPGGVVPFPWDAITAVEFQNPASDVVQKVTIMRNRDDRALVVLQVVLQPGDRFRVQVVGWLVQEQDIRFGQKQPGQRHTPPLPSREHRNRHVGRWAIERAHCQF